MKNEDRYVVYVCEKCHWRNSYKLTEVPGMDQVLADEREAERKRIKEVIEKKSQEYFKEHGFTAKNKQLEDIVNLISDWFFYLPKE
jgi:hypothetical protein